LRGGAEDLGRRPLRLGVRRPEQHPAAPHGVVAAANLETNGDELSVEANGGEVVDDRVARVRCGEACRLCRHAAPRAGLCKDIRVEDLRNTFGREVGRGTGEKAPPFPRPSSPFPQILNGTGANVTTNSASATHASQRRDAGSGRGASSTGGCARRPRANTSTSTPHTYQPHHQRPNRMMTHQNTKAIRWCQRGSAAYRMCPPSSCEIGSRLSIVTNIPNHPAKAKGWT